MNKIHELNVSKYLKSNTLAQIAEILVVFLAAFLIIYYLLPLAGENLIKIQAVIWIANIVMLILVWLGLRIRGESWADFGLNFKKVGSRKVLKTFLLSLLVFALAMIGFILGSIIMANITGIPEGANMSSYDYLKDNLGMLFVTLIGVYIVSSFGEEVIYRAFLINRISAIGRDTKTWRILAVIVSAIIFGFAHYSWGPMGIVQTGFMGLVLAICYLKFKKNLWILILAHVYMDTILMVQMYLASN
jgi:membrane protease YdiL (CAAX protease family)